MCAVCSLPVKRKTLLSSSSFSNSKGDTQNSIGAQLALVVGTIKLNHQVIDFLLLSNVLTEQFGSNVVIDVVNSLGNTY